MRYMLTFFRNSSGNRTGVGNLRRKLPKSVAFSVVFWYIKLHWENDIVISKTHIGYCVEVRTVVEICITM